LTELVDDFTEFDHQYYHSYTDQTGHGDKAEIGDFAVGGLEIYHEWYHKIVENPKGVPVTVVTDTGIRDVGSPHQPSGSHQPDDVGMLTVTPPIVP